MTLLRFLFCPLGHQGFGVAVTDIQVGPQVLRILKACIQHGDILLHHSSVNETQFDNPINSDLAHPKGRILSNAPVLDTEYPHHGRTLQTIDDIFLAHQVNGKVTIEHVT